MIQMTVEQLLDELHEAIAKDYSVLKKKIVVADDNEGNGFHGIYYSCTVDPKEVKANIEASNGLYDSQATNYNDIIIIG